MTATHTESNQVSKH